MAAGAQRHGAIEALDLGWRYGGETCSATVHRSTANWHERCLCICMPVNRYCQGKVMDVFSPEFSQFWLAGNALRPVDAKAPQREDDAVAQQAAMQELVDRVNAARSVV